MFATRLIAAIVVFVSTSLSVAQNTPTHEPTFTPTLVINQEIRVFRATWNPRMAVDKTNGFYYIYSSNFHSEHDGGIKKCTDFDEYSCTTFLAGDKRFFTDDTLQTRMTSSDSESSMRDVVRASNGVVVDGDLLFAVYKQGSVIKCVDEDKCFPYIDQSTPGIPSVNNHGFSDMKLDAFENLYLTHFQNQKIYQCTLGSSPSCSMFADLADVSSIDNICNPMGIDFDSEMSTMFVTCGTNNVLECPMTGIASGAGSATCTDIFLSKDAEYLDGTKPSLGGYWDNLVTLAVVGSSVYLGHDDYDTGKLLKCTGSCPTAGPCNNCIAVVTKRSFDTSRDDDGAGATSVQTVTKDFKGNVFASTWSLIFEVSDTGAIYSESSTTEELGSGGIAAAVLAGVFGTAFFILLGVYVSNFSSGIPVPSKDGVVEIAQA